MYFTFIVFIAALLVNAEVNHSEYNKLLKKYVDEKGLVYYKEWKQNDIETLDLYLNAMKQIDPQGLNKNEKIAFWINTYNALTIRAMLEFYPIKSIKEKVSSFWGYNVWEDYTIKIHGKEYSLDYIEHKILRKLNEPRIHFGLVCASISCPRLIGEAFTGKKLTGQLEGNAKVFFKNKSKFRIDKKNKTVWLSKIFDWFGEDFGESEKEILSFISGYLPAEDAEFIKENISDIDVEYLEYNWGLNERTIPLNNKE